LAIGQNGSNPVVKGHAGRTQRLVELAELEMCMGVNERWQDGNIAQVQRGRAAGRWTDPDDFSTRDQQFAVLDRRRIDRKQVAGPKSGPWYRASGQASTSRWNDE